jgi:hypothetical protein
MAGTCSRAAPHQVLQHSHEPAFLVYDAFRSLGG